MSRMHGGVRQTRTSVLAGRYTAANNPNPSGVTNGTPGGTVRGPGIMPSGKGPGMKFRIGDEGYLWILILIEVILMGVLRRWSRSHHGG